MTGIQCTSIKHYLERKKKMRTVAGKQKTFTLIELLVVIAIIAILAAILMPALSQSRMRAKMTTCLNQVKDIQIAKRSYLEDHNDHIMAGDGGTDAKRAYIACLIHGKYVRRHFPSLFCPLIDPNPLNKGASDTFNRGRYGYASTQSGTPVYYKNVQQPSKLIDIFDGGCDSTNKGDGTNCSPVPGGQPYNKNWKTYARFWTIHNGKAGAAMFDGHAEMLEPNQLLRNGQNTTIYATHGEYAIWFWDKESQSYRPHLVRQYFNEAKIGVNFN